MDPIKKTGLVPKDGPQNPLMDTGAYISQYTSSFKKSS